MFINNYSVGKAAYVPKLILKFDILDGELNLRLAVPVVFLEEIAEDLEYRCYMSEQYPTADALEVERTPLN